VKLEPGERSILATFASGPDAEAALRELKQNGYKDSRLDRIGEYGFQPDRFEKRPAISGNEPSLVNAVLKPERLDDNSRVLLGATNDASGLAGPMSMDHSPFLITVVTDDLGVDPAVEILERLGGRV